MGEARDAPVRWSPEQGALVGADGQRVTRAQEVKAAKIRELGLLRLVERGPQLLVYECLPLPACHLTYRLTVNRLTRQVSCNCQAARGTRVQAPRRCSHTLALQDAVLRHEVEA